MKHRKAVTLINIAGLVLGITGAVLIFEYVFYERSYDAYHKNADNVYRLVYDRYQSGSLMYKTTGAFYASGNWLMSNYSEVEDFFMLERYYNIEVSVKGEEKALENFFEEKAYYVSNSVFRILDLPLILGTDSCLAAPGTVAISERVAKKLFKDQNPVGKILTVDNRDNYAITGVYRDIPSNSHLKTDLLFSFATVLARRPHLQTSWTSDFRCMYLLLRPGTDYKKLEKEAFPRMIRENYAELLAPKSRRDEYHLQPIKSIHLHSSIEYEHEPPGNGKGVDILFGFALFLLIIAWINYVNLITARSVERAKEVGVKKVCGADRPTLIRQFVFESIIFNLFCIVLSGALIFLCMPFFKQLTGIEHFGSIIGTKFLLYSGLFIFSGIVLSSIYPAFVLSSFAPIEVLKGKFRNSAQGIGLRKALITFQLFISVSLFIGAGIIYKQVDYLTQKDLGYTYQSVLVVKAPRTNEQQSEYQGKIELLRENLQRNPNVLGFTFVSDIPGEEIGRFFEGYKKGLDIKSSGTGCFRTDVDADFTDFFRIKLLAGRSFNEDDKVSQTKVIFSNKAVARFGFDSPEDAVGGKVIAIDKREYEIIGVFDDVNYYSVKAETAPIVFTNRDYAKQYMAVKYSGTSELKSIIDQIKPEYKNIFPNNAFEYEVLEDKIAGNTKTDRTFSLVFGIFSALAGVISIIGIMGLVIIIINQNMKTLGIRRVLGAGLPDVNSYLWKHFYPQLIVAVCLAIPVSYYVFQKQVLENYVYRISVSPTYLILPVILIAAVLALVVVAFARKAFSENLTRILKSE